MRAPLVALTVAAALAAPTPAGAFALDHLLTTYDIGRNKVPHVGTSRILVVPTRIGEAFPAGRLETLRRFYDPAGGPGTFREYWQIVSLGTWDPIPTLVEPVLYTDRCPVPGRDVNHCTVSVADISLIASGGLGVAVEDILGRVRDEQDVDFSDFDVNGADGPGPDGYFDGVIFDSDIYNGIAFPLAAFGNEAILEAFPGGPTVTLGIIAMAPPDLHEFGHDLGFIDLYNGPPVNCLMADMRATLSAFSRQQIGWGEVRPVAGSLELDLKPVLAGGPVLRVGFPPRYLLIENRAGAKHAELESSVAGVYVYSVDEDRLPSSPLGFLDVENQRLYYPNEGPPYLNVNLPVGCSLTNAAATKRCALRDGEERELVHASGEDTGATLRVGTAAADGTVKVTVTGAPVLDAGVADAAPIVAPIDDGGGGCGVARGQGGGAVLVLVAFTLAAARRRRAGPRKGSSVPG